ncbi:MAG: hypothetical protein BGP16_02840 [Sphingobium sp. 66-54]|nr:MAG: hypothetical protein BGP16_02840 [Sphingobium sp. 66-54]
MSGAVIVRGAIHAALSGDADLAALVQQVSDGAPLKASAPWLQLDDSAATGWGARGVDGIALRQPIRLTLRGDDGARAEAVVARVEVVLAGMASEAGGWRITSLRLDRARIVRGRAGWRVTLDYDVRAARLG